MVVLFFREYHYQLLACENKKKAPQHCFRRTLSPQKCILKEYEVNPNSKFVNF